MNDTELRKLLIQDEGKRNKVYKDTRGILTIGVGRNLESAGLSDTEVEFLLSNDINERKAQLNQLIPWWVGLSDNRQMVLMSIAFNVGVHGLLGYRNMLAAARLEHWSEAAAQILDSDAARELPNRYSRLADLMEKG